MDINILKIASDTKNNKHIHNCTHSTKHKSQICGDEIEIFSFKNKNPNKAVINGIAARHSKVIAAVVLVIDHINVIIAVPRPIPPIRPDIPTLK